MSKFFASIFGLFLSPLGLVVLAALDSSMVFFLPAAVEAAVVILTARYRELVWLFPILAAGGSMAGSSTALQMKRTRAGRRDSFIRSIRGLEYGASTWLGQADCEKSVGAWAPVSV